ncbi:hypothetical protein PILCRDRAFT_620727 [Piloderma croceum F 1598]|uniref:Uncharacterized protein n=1 Tax=Piloderma croceum (strain F 1598) TaxID=765440 RepID=A0A0C3FCD1_PILCF|nr:hypothetical protein PILCRDRAFT_620727 [Piloderma croceum F 1598]
MVMIIGSIRIDIRMTIAKIMLDDILTMHDVYMAYQHCLHQFYLLLVNLAAKYYPKAKIIFLFDLARCLLCII